MQHIGQSVESTLQGAAAALSFSSAAAGFIYIAYHDKDYLAGFAGTVCLFVTGLATYNTFALNLGGEDAIANDYTM